MVSCTTPGVADRPDTGPGTVNMQEHNDKIIIISNLYSNHSLSCSVSTVSAGSLYGPCSPSIIDCCYLHRVAGEWSESIQHMLSAPLSCSVYNGDTIAVAQSVSSDGSSLVRAGYCSPHYSE